MKNILVVGGSSGVGLEVLKRESEENHCINISRRKPDFAGDFEHHSIDILNDELPTLDAVDALVYCPGSINLKPVQSLKEDDLRKDFEINVVGAFKVIKHYLPQLKQSGDGSIVLFGTVAVKTGMAFHTSVAAAKGAVEALARTLAAELAPKVRVNCVSPSLTDTPLAEKLLKSDRQRENGADRHPLKRIGQPGDIAAAVHFLVHNASWVSGETLRVDGGMSYIHQ